MSKNRINTTFPFGIGVGGSTGSELTCEFCGKVHNKGYDIDKNGVEGESICYIDFMGKTMAECCFRKLEKNIFALREDIVEWLIELSKTACEQAKRDELTATKGKNALEISENTITS